MNGVVTKLIGLALAATAGLTVTAVSAQRPTGTAEDVRLQKPVIYHGPSFVDGIGRLAVSLDHLTELSSVVVLGTITEARPRDIVVPPDPKIPGNNGATLIQTQYTLQVTEIFKSPVPPAPTVSIVLSGGDRDRGTFIDRHFSDMFPVVPQVGETYLLFLSESNGRYSPTTGDTNSVLWIKDDRIRGRDNALGAELSSLSPQALMDRLRSRRQPVSRAP